MNYRKRIADAELSDALCRAGAVLIEGARGCGKTSTAQRAAGSVVRVDVDPSIDLYLQTEPDRALQGATPRLLDEWQRQPALWDLVRRAVDDRGTPGQFILTGSAMPDPAVPRHSGAGRFSVLRMRPMTLWESGYSTGEISLQAIASGSHVPSVDASSHDLQDWAEIICRGGWPSTLDSSLHNALAYVSDYLELIVHADVSEVAGVRRDPGRVSRLIASLARNVSGEAGIATLSRDAGDANSPLSRDTTARYLEALERLMVIEPLPAWQTALRDSATLRKAPVWHFVDPSLAPATWGASPTQLVAEPKTLGLLFESLAVRDLRVYASASRGRLFRARDSADRETDVIIQYPQGWIACEIKLGMRQAEQAASTLARFVSIVDTQTVGPCLARLVIVGAGPSYRLADGTYVTPLSALKP